MLTPFKTFYFSRFGLFILFRKHINLSDLTWNSHSMLTLRIIEELRRIINSYHILPRFTDPSSSLSLSPAQSLACSLASTHASKIQDENSHVNIHKERQYGNLNTHSHSHTHTFYLHKPKCIILTIIIIHIWMAWKSFRVATFCVCVYYIVYVKFVCVLLSFARLNKFYWRSKIV